jgi:hypothetical protein
MNIRLEPFKSIYTISLDDTRESIQGNFNGVFETQRNEIANSISDFYLDSLIEVEYQNERPVLIMVNLFDQDDVWMDNKLISKFSLKDVLNTFRDLDEEIYTDGNLVLLFNTGVGFYFDEDEDIVKQICTFKKATNRFEKIMYNFKKI